MAGYCTGPNPQVGREEFVLTYLQALSQSNRPGLAVRTKYDMTLKKYERARALLSKHGWLPYGRLTSADEPRAREVFKAKLQQVQRAQLAREDATAARERGRELAQLKTRAVQQRVAQDSSQVSVVLDRFGV